MSPNTAAPQSRSAEETVMSTSLPVLEARVTFPNQSTSMAGILFTPANFDKTKTYPALAVAHPFGGVKEQTSGNYARKMAEKGYVALAFDASHQGESGGYPRDTENPSERLEDIRCAVDYLTTLPWWMWSVSDFSASAPEDHTYSALHPLKCGRRPSLLSAFGTWA